MTILDFSDYTRFYTPEEIELIRKMKREGNARVCEIGKTRGYTVHPIVKAAREKRYDNARTLEITACSTGEIHDPWDE